MAVFMKCDLCGAPSELKHILVPAHPDWYCNKCWGLLISTRKEIQKELKAEYALAQKSLTLVSLLSHVAENRPEHFKYCFGQEALDMLLEVARELKSVKKL